MYHHPAIGSIDLKSNLTSRRPQSYGLANYLAPIEFGPKHRALLEYLYGVAFPNFAMPITSLRSTSKNGDVSSWYGVNQVLRPLVKPSEARVLFDVNYLPPDWDNFLIIAKFPGS